MAEKSMAVTGQNQPVSKPNEETQSALLELFVDGIKDIYWTEKH
jgi:hypothetical protein